MVDSKQIALNTDVSMEIFKIIKRQLEIPFNLQQYVNTMTSTLERYMLEQLVMLAESKSRFDSLDEMEQEWNSKHTGVNKPKYYNLDGTMTYQLAKNMMEVASILNETVGVECFFLFQDVRFHYKSGKLYGNSGLMPDTTKESLATLFFEIGLRYQIDFLNSLGANMRLV